MAEAEAKIYASSEESEDEDEYEYNDYTDSSCYICNQEHYIHVLFDNYNHSISQIGKIYHHKFLGLIRLEAEVLGRRDTNLLTNKVKKPSTFSLISKTETVKLSGRILSRIFPNSYAETDFDEEKIEETSHQSKVF
ncbi:hypothetical protein TNCT_525091 [Trichonephila clavata]|uniref:Uncharacterized protein n=1 Tax=Trichonephila clavata TaxID=2740835 RepID=A0A8X6G901_TRICU|nr:hypothetical protein TNCT_525091 [Trichonephila clavata]